ncbi:hypothetical protein H6P81_015874 [Aristolochia fimbriata]|uniref:Integrase catalytic domain-containing protein n=1 Tax=Aristolochia fimbriata TaxID=158543 RepID=A0AAV7E8H9_ARIFI|nr:hypothetical protein H6P81_015874 [Aristolochia fimbriata]
MTQKPFDVKKKRKKSEELLDLIHSDICGPINVPSRHGHKYFITFIDDYSKYGYVYLLNKKSDALESFKEFKAEVEKSTGKIIKGLMSDRGGEYCSDLFNSYCIENGIVHYLSIPRTPQQNGVSERRNGTFLEMVRSMMSGTNLPLSLWSEALKTAAYLLNSVPRDDRSKIEPKTLECFFVGYPLYSKGFRLYDKSNGVIFESRNVTFLESIWTEKTEKDHIDILEIQENVEPISSSLPSTSEVPQHPPVQDNVRRSQRQIRAPNRYTLVGDSYPRLEDKDILDPHDYDSAIADIEAKKWDIAMKEEMDSMQKNKVWTLVEPPKNCKPIGCKWIFKRKRNSEGQVEKYKARLVAKGYTQRKGFDYDDTFSPVAKITSIRIILSIVAYFDYDLFQMDVKTAFLNGDLEEELYMEQPDGFVIDATKVCKLTRAIYGLKQASRQWYMKFDQSIKAFEFESNSEDPCVYIKRQNWLQENFEMKDLGMTSYILGIKIERNRSAKMLALSQTAYVDNILERYCMSACKPTTTPISKGDIFSKAQCPQNEIERQKMDNMRSTYCSAIGSLMYLMTCTRPDICFVVSLLSRYQSDPGPRHWEGVKRVLRYIKGTRTARLVFSSSTLMVEGYSDSDYQGDQDDRKSTSGYVFMFGGGAISWKSKKQDCIAISTMEAEYIACSLAAQEAIWIRNFLRELCIVDSIKDPITMYCDNEAARSLSKDSRYHSRAKHIDGKYHFIRDKVQKNQLVVERKSSAEMLADPMTKGLNVKVFIDHVRSMGIVINSPWF